MNNCQSTKVQAHRDIMAIYDIVVERKQTLEDTIFGITAASGCPQATIDQLIADYSLMNGAIGALEDQINTSFATINCSGCP